MSRYIISIYRFLSFFIDKSKKQIVTFWKFLIFINILFAYFFLQSQVQVQMSMEISPQHHSIVLGKQSSNLKMIMQRTATQIMFPDAGDPNIPSLKKSNVTITGDINNVYLARQQLVVSRYIYPSGFL